MMLDAHNLTKKYRYGYALDGMTIEIDDGSLFGLVGPNGAGKTTLLRMIVGLLVPDRGDMHIGGIDAISHPYKIRDLIGYVPDEWYDSGNITVSEYMLYFASGYGIDGYIARQQCTELLSQVGLIDRSDEYVETLSRGMKQRLMLARSLIHDPQFIILDEPTSGLDPHTRAEYIEIMRQLCASGKTILLCSHILSDIASVCTDIGIIDQGRLIISGKVDKILDDIEHSNPLKVTVLMGSKEAMNIFHANPFVKAVTKRGNFFELEFDGDDREEAILLKELMDAEIPVAGFVREPGTLETFFESVTRCDNTKVVAHNDY